MKAGLYLDAYDRSTTANGLIIRRLVKRIGFTISHRAFQSYGKIKRGMWWFGDKKFGLVSPEQVKCAVNASLVHTLVHSEDYGTKIKI